MIMLLLDINSKKVKKLLKEKKIQIVLFRLVQEFLQDHIMIIQIDNKTQ